MSQNDPELSIRIGINKDDFDATKAQLVEIASLIGKIKGGLRFSRWFLIGLGAGYILGIVLGLLTP